MSPSGQPVNRAGRTVGVSGVVVIIEHLNLDQPHQEDAAVPATLAFAFHFGRRRPFDMKLTIAKTFLCADIAGAGHAFHRAIANDPFRRFPIIAFPFRKIGAIEQHHRVRGRLAGLLLGAKSAGRNDLGLWPIAIVDGPGMMLVRRIAVERRARVGGGARGG